MSQKQKFFFVGIIALAIFFRFHLLTVLPGGLFPDEAANGLDINLMQSGNLQPFYERGNGREALFFYMLWGFVEVFGKGHWQHHAVSATVGVLSVALCFLVTRRLMQTALPAKTGEELKGWENRASNIALLASFLMAVSSWHTVLSRTAFRANLIPLFASLTFYFLLKTFQEENPAKKYFDAFWTGMVFALGFYSYIAFRILVPVIMFLIIWPWFANAFKDGLKRYWKHFCILILAFSIFIWPLAKYFYTHPGSFVGRSGQVSVFNPDLNQGNLIGLVIEVAKLSLAAYFTQGDLNWRHNLSGFPFLSQLVSPFFGAALVSITFLAVWYVFSPKKRASWWKYAVLAAWFWGMLLPVIATAEGIPHGLRSIGTIPPVFIITALGLYKIGEWFWALHKKFNEFSPVFKTEKLLVDPELLLRNIVLRFFMKLTVACFLAAVAVQAYFGYFVFAANSAENYYAFRSDLTPVSRYLKDRCKKASTYLVLDKFSVQTTDYLTSNNKGDFSNPCNVPYKQVDPENSWQLSGLTSGDEVIFTQSSIYDIKKFKKYHPEASLRLEIRNKFGQAAMAVYRFN
ncbi:MAG: hypothetical protein HYZ51_01630 [Candidatus Doudnabacteria bacterium]|nr:hypothetical protein [Candidatus Doudnabacteria bacterium]